MLLGLFSVFTGTALLYLAYNLAEDGGLNASLTIIGPVVLLFGARITYVDAKAYMAYRRAVRTYLNGPDAGHVYPPDDIVHHRRVRQVMLEGIHNGTIRQSNKGLNPTIAFDRRRHKLILFHILFSPDNDYKMYRRWRRTYQTIDQATRAAIETEAKVFHTVDHQPKYVHRTNEAIHTHQRNTPWCLIWSGLGAP